MRDRATILVLERHNDEVRELTAAAEKGNPARVPVNFAGFDERFFILNPKINTKKITWRQACADADAAIALRLQNQRWWHGIERPFADIVYPTQELPDVWEGCTPFFESAHELELHGASVWYSDTGENPESGYLLAGEENKWRFQGRAVDADPDGDGPFGRTVRLWREIRRKTENLRVDGRPVAPPQLPWRLSYGDGPFTLACGLRGVELMTDFFEDPDYSHALLRWITEGIIARQRAADAVRAAEGEPLPPSPWISVGDDSAAMLSPNLYRAFVTPYARMYLEAFDDGKRKRFAHMCGDAQHLFPIMHGELGVAAFDTGFPCDLGRARAELGPEVHLQGNVTPARMLLGDMERLKGEVLAILRSGVCRGRRFLLKDGTNVPPCTSLETLERLYAFAREAGRYTGDGDDVAAMNMPDKDTPPWRKNTSIG